MPWLVAHHEGSAGELRAVIGPHRRGVAAEDRCLIEHACHVGTRDAEVHGDVDALVAEVIGHGQALEPASVGQAVADEIHAPYLVDRRGQLQRHALERRAPDLLALAHRQAGFAVEAVHALVVDAGELRAQQVMDAPIAEATAHLRDLHDLALQRSGLRIGLRRMAVAVSGEPHEAACAALRQVMFLDHLADGPAFGLWG